MNHLIISREYPPATYPAGGIGTYVANITRLLAERGETVHVIGERWEGAPLSREISHESRLIVHRIGANDPLQPHWPNVTCCAGHELDGLRGSTFSSQWFAWHAAFLAEWLIEEDNIDVIEAQEWEAPLYYFLLRRALGIGPKRHPPCIVHLHTPTEFIFRSSGSILTSRGYTRVKRMEEYCIRATDTLLCPSRFLARLCADHYGLPLEFIKIIQLPVGHFDLIERAPDVWARGSICFVGRLEPRKGIIEWIEAATRVAQEDAVVTFDIVGADVWGLQRMLVGRIPRRLRARFRFHGPKSRAEISKILAGARAAVVPSRFENFPNVCIEAMSAGLPVIATRLGGMVELLEDGRTGWLTPDTGVSGMVDGLTDALRRCLATSPAELASMGRSAAETVRGLCDNERTVNEQIAFRIELVRSGARRSLTLPSNLLSRAGPRATPVVANADCRGAGIIVRVHSPTAAGVTLESICSQTVPPRAVAIVHDRLPTQEKSPPPNGLGDENMMLVYCSVGSGANRWYAGLEALQKRARCGFWVLLDEYDSLLPQYLSQIEKIFAHRPEVGVITPWSERTTERWLLEAPLCPDPRYQLTVNEITSATAFRTEAVEGAKAFWQEIRPEYLAYELANAVIAEGWRAVAYPQILARRCERRNALWPIRTLAGTFRTKFLDRFGESIMRERGRLVDQCMPIPVAIADRDSVDHAPTAELVLLCLKVVVHHRRRIALRIIRKGEAVLTELGSHLGLTRSHTEL